MESPERGALTLVRMIGVVLLVWSVLDLGLYWAKCHSPKLAAPVEPLSVAIKLVPSVLGLVVLIRARAIARWISETLDL